MSVNTSSLPRYVLLDGLEAAGPELLVPRWFLYGFLSLVVGGGLLVNCLLAVHLARGQRPSVTTALLHLCLVDSASLLLLASPEVLVLSDPTGAWTLPRYGCPVFLSLEVLLGTATVYILIVVNFSAAVGADKTSLKIPLMMVWLLSCSLSVPDLVFAEVVTAKTGYDICYLPKRASFLIGIFRLSLPVFLLFISTVLVIFAMFRTDPPSGLRLALVLSLAYTAVSVQRSVLGVLYEMTFPPPPGPDAFRNPPLADVIHNPAGSLALVLGHYTLAATRPLVTWSLSPQPVTDNQVA